MTSLEEFEHLRQDTGRRVAMGLACCVDCVYCTDNPHSHLFLFCDAKKQPTAGAAQACTEWFAPRSPDKKPLFSMEEEK